MNLLGLNNEYTLGYSDDALKYDNWWNQINLDWENG